jgi:multicomponent Na+:H+ antiporter subunit G
MSWSEWIQTVLLLSGALFHLAGTAGLLRFPDVYTRVHALTKADNLGLGLIVLGVIPSLPTVGDMIEVLVIWALVLAASSTNGHLVARRARDAGVPVWTTAGERTP